MKDRRFSAWNAVTSANIAAIPNKLNVKSFCKGTLPERFHSFVDGTDKPIKKILFCTNLLPRIKKLWRERAKPKDVIRAEA